MKSRLDDVESYPEIQGKKRRSWLCMGFLHKVMFGVRLQLDWLHLLCREIPQNSEGRKKNAPKLSFLAISLPITRNESSCGRTSKVSLSIKSIQSHERCSELVPHFPEKGIPKLCNLH